MWQCEQLFAVLALLLLRFPHTGWGSESPERDCCTPIYPFLIPTSSTIRPTNPQSFTTTQKSSGLITPPKPTDGALSCLLARQLCSEDLPCAQILQIIPKVCGLELVACSTVTVTKCQAALRTLQGFPYFSPTCLCKEPHLDYECNQVREFLFDHPCGVVHTKEDDPYPIDALPLCSHALNVCQQSKSCMRLYHDFQKSCYVGQNGQCEMDAWASCQSAWSKLRLSPMFGCICPNGDAACDRVFRAVNNNPCINAFLPASSGNYKSIQFWKFWYKIFNISISDFPPNTYLEVTPTVGVSYRTNSQQSVEESVATPVYFQTSYGPRSDEDSKVQLQSTCHIALEDCEKDVTCNRYLDDMKRSCDSLTCDRKKCMTSIQDFYRNIPQVHSMEIAFCLCKNTPSPDEKCLRAQSILHPTCSQAPPSGKQPPCHRIAQACQQDKVCRKRLEKFDQACSVDGSTKTCAGPPDVCRQAMINILGTELRTSCACESTTADFRELYECIGWRRVLWVNPCVVEAQKDFHRFRGKSVTSTYPTASVYNPVFTPPPSTTHNKVPHFFDTTPSPYIPPVVPSRRTSFDRITPTPMRPTSPQSAWPTPPWPTYRPTTTTTAKATTTTTTTTTLPPKFCVLERSGQPVKYIREGYKKRLYKFDDPECSELCECNHGEVLSCKVLECIKREACNTGVAFYSHASPFYQAYRGQCLCYSGSFICSKPPKDVELVLPQGVFLFLGFSKKDERLLKDVTGNGSMEAIGAIQGLVSYHNVNMNKSDCRIKPVTWSNENIVLQALIDEHEAQRIAGNLTALILNREKEECFDALQSISTKINTNDPDMRSHVVLSMIKVAAAEADVPDLPANAPSRKATCLTLVIVFSQILLYTFIL